MTVPALLRDTWAAPMQGVGLQLLCQELVHDMCKATLTACRSYCADSGRIADQLMS